MVLINFQNFNVDAFFLGCSTVLLPTKIVHALNLNVEDINSQPSTQCGIFPSMQFSSKHTMWSFAKHTMFIYTNIFCCKTHHGSDGHG